MEHQPIAIAISEMVIIPPRGKHPGYEDVVPVLPDYKGLLELEGEGLVYPVATDEHDHIGL